MKMDFIHLSRPWYEIALGIGCYGYIGWYMWYLWYEVLHVNVVCFHLLVWSEYGMKCLTITKYIEIVFYGLFIKKKNRIPWSNSPGPGFEK